MVKIMFVCHGNICRSPMPEFVLKDMVKRRGLKKNFVIASSATGTEKNMEWCGQLCLSACKGCS